MAYTLNYSYIQADNAYSVVGYADDPDIVEIPSTYKGTHGELPVVSIGTGAFYNCISLTSIKIPLSVTFIGENALRNCSSLTSITINAVTPPSLVNANAFDNTNNCPIYVHRQSVNAYKTAEKWSDLSARIQEIPRKVVDFESLATYDTKIKEYISEHSGGEGDVTQEELEQAIAEVNASISEVKGNIPTALSELTQDSTHRTITDAQITAWDNKSDFSGSYNDLTNKPTIPTTAEEVNAVPITRTINGKALSGNITLSAKDVGALADNTKYGASFEFILDTTTFELTARLKDQDGNVLGNAQTVDLPLESVVVDGSYDSATREVVLTLQSGSKIRFSVADLVSGLQTQITAQNKLNADLVDDTNSTHKFVTAQNISDWNNKQSLLTFDTTPTTGSTNPVTSGGIKTATDNAVNDGLVDYDKAIKATFNITSANTTVTLQNITPTPTRIIWGDGIVDTSFESATITHTYTAIGKYVCLIIGAKNIGELPFSYLPTELYIPNGYQINGPIINYVGGGEANLRYLALDSNPSYPSAFYDYRFATELHLMRHVSELSINCFTRWENLKVVKIDNIVPPTIASSTFGRTSCLFEVPLESLNAYKTATNWSALATRIVAKVDTNYLTEQLPQILDYTSEV